MAEDVKRSHNQGIGRFFTSHYAMERFSLFFMVLLALFIVVIIWCAMWLKASADSEYRSTAVQETSAVGTVSGVTLTPLDLAVDSETNPKAAVMLLQFDDPSKIPSRANDYEVHITGVDGGGNKREIVNEMAGSIYMYGTTGYGAIYLVCPAGFTDELYRITLEATKSVSSSDVVSDRFAFTINPGHPENVLTVDSLSDGFDPLYLYRELIIAKRETSIRDNLDADLEVMKEMEAAVDEYFHRLEDDGVSTKGMLPTAMANDTIGADSNGDLFLSTDYVYPNGLDFEWRATKLSSNQSYFSADKDLRFEYSHLATKDGTRDTKGDEAIPVWKMADGQMLTDALANMSSAKSEQVSSNVELVEGAIKAYMTAKQVYQCSHLVQLLDLEESSASLADTLTAHENCLDVY